MTNDEFCRTDILDNGFVILEFDNGGPRMMLEICMFAEASKNQVSKIDDEFCIKNEEFSIVNEKLRLKMMDFAGGGQRGGCGGQA